MNCPTWRVPRPHRPGNPAVKAPPVPATRFFDNLSYVGNEMVGCFVLDTGSGLICLDNMEPDDALYIEQGIRDLGYDPAGLKHILITHGHLDHFGNAVYFREKYGTKLWMSKTDEVWAKDVDALPEKNVKIPLAFGMDGNLEDGQIFTLGDARIECLWTPGHTPGCMSFLFTVYDEGRPHTCALWGGTGPRKTLAENQQLLASIHKFQRRTAQRGVDVAISTHPFMDNAVTRLALCRTLSDGVPNPFVIGRDANRRFELMYQRLYEDVVAGMKARQSPPNN